MQALRVSARLAGQMVMRGKTKQEKKAAVAATVAIVDSPMQDKLNGLYLKALESPKRPKPELTEEEKARQSAIAKEYVRRSWWRHNEMIKDLNAKNILRMEAITALPTEAMQLAALMTPNDPALPVDYRRVTERPPAEGWHRPRVSQAAQDLADADDFFKAQASLDGAVTASAAEEETAALGAAVEMNEDGEKARRLKKSK